MSANLELIIFTALLMAITMLIGLLFVGILYLFLIPFAKADKKAENIKDNLVGKVGEVSTTIPPYGNGEVVLNTNKGIQRLI